MNAPDLTEDEGVVPAALNERSGALWPPPEEEKQANEWLAGGVVAHGWYRRASTPKDRQCRENFLKEAIKSSAFCGFDPAAGGRGNEVHPVGDFAAAHPFARLVLDPKKPGYVSVYAEDSENAPIYRRMVHHGMQSMAALEASLPTSAPSAEPAEAPPGGL